MTRNETIEKLLEELAVIWSSNPKGNNQTNPLIVRDEPWLREIANKILSLFPDQHYDEEWAVPDKNTPVDAKV